jgi:hypothetical protein
MSENKENFFEAMDSGDLWGQTNNQDAGASTEEVQTVETTQDSGRQPEQPAINNETQSQEGIQENSQDNPGQIQFPEDFELKDIPEHYSPEDAYNMGRYHQSKASKAERELAEMKQQYQALQLYNQMQQFQASGANQNGQPVAGQAQPEAPQRPVKPKRPATEDTYSDEWQEYQRDVMQYQLDMTDYNTQVYESQQKRINQFQEQRRRDRELEEARITAYNEAKYTHGLNDAQANAFLQFAQNEDAMNDMGLWINAWKISQGQSPNNTVSRNQSGGIREEVKHQATATGIQGTGSGVPEKKEENPFFAEKKQLSINDLF